MRHNEGMPTDFSEWITATTGKSANALTKLIGKDTTAITRPDTSGSVPAHTVIAVCRAAGVSILDGLEVAGHIDHTDREIASATGKLDLLPDSALLTQLLHRATLREQPPTDELAAKRAQPSRILTHNPYAGEPMAAQTDTPDASTNSLDPDDA